MTTKNVVWHPTFLIKYACPDSDHILTVKQFMHPIKSIAAIAYKSPLDPFISNKILTLDVAWTIYFIEGLGLHLPNNPILHNNQPKLGSLVNIRGQA